MNEGIETILLNLGNLKRNEKLCIISDKKTKKIGNLFYEFAKQHNYNVIHLNIEPFKIHGEEPPKNVADIMKFCNLTLGLTNQSMVHTKARKNAEKLGNRFLSLPDYSLEILKHPSLQINFKKLSKKALMLSYKFTKANTIQITTKKGTKLYFAINERKGNFSPGFVNKKILLGSPPDIETNVCPLEKSANGVIVVDGSIPIPKIGLLKNPIILHVKNGKLVHIEGKPSLVKFLNQLFNKYGDKSRILAECGVGFNNKAKLCGNMLIDEGTYGTIHFGFGSNITIGGLNKVNFHLDFVLYANKMNIDGQIIHL